MQSEIPFCVKAISDVGRIGVDDLPLQEFVADREIPVLIESGVRSQEPED